MQSIYLICVLLGLAAQSALFAQDAITCQSSSSPSTVRKEGLNEALGAITIDCRGGTAGSRQGGSLTVQLSRTLANRVVNDTVQEAQLQIDTGSGFRTIASGATRLGTNGLSFNGFTFDVPASQRFTLQVSRLRAEVAGSDAPITATIGLNGLNNLALNGNFLTVGQPLTGLFSSLSFVNIVDLTKTLPSSFDEAAQNAIPSFTARVTEGFSTAFQAKQDGADTGIRVMVRYSAVPAGVRLAVPDVVAGSSAQEPTSAGGFGGPFQAGRATTGALLLARVLQPASDGSGGILATFNQPSLPFGTLREVPLNNGAGVAVYEVLDGNPFLTESAQIPTFIELRSFSGGTSRANISFAPIRTSSANAPIPSFIDVEPGTDCQTSRDCENAPRLTINADPLTVTSVEATGFQVRYVRINNAGGGSFLWSAKVAYTNGSGWLRLDRTEGLGNSTIRVDFLPDKVPGPGTYNATLTIDAGSTAGSRVLPVQFVVTANPVLRGPAITSAVHAATGLEGMVPSGLSVLKGARFNGNNVEVKIGGVVAKIVQRNADQISFEVPWALFGKPSADVVVTVDGTASLPFPAKLSPVMPAVFSDGVTATSLRVTGIPQHALQTITFRVPGVEDLLRPTSVDPVADTPGVYTLGYTLPENVAGPTTDLQVCAADFCGPAVKVPVTVAPQQ